MFIRVEVGDDSVRYINTNQIIAINVFNDGVVIIYVDESESTIKMRPDQMRDLISQLQS